MCNMCTLQKSVRGLSHSIITAVRSFYDHLQFTNEDIDLSLLLKVTARSGGVRI